MITPSPSTVSSYLQSLLQNFNALYEEKLAETDSSDSNDDSNTLQMRNAIIEDWVRDLNEQNKVLIETVDEMEKEAEDKIHLVARRSEQFLKF